MITKPILEKLEYEKILNYIAKYAVTEPGKIEILNTVPLDNKSLVELEGKYVTEAKEIIIKSDVPPINYLPDLFEDLSITSIEGAVINGKKILAILNLAQTSRFVFQFLKNQTEAGKLAENFLQGLFVDKVFEHHIQKIVDENGEVKDNASSKLSEIRNEINRKTDSLSKVINKILKNLSDSYLVREEYITLRDGRMVVPVKSEHKRHVKGFIHSESSTGQTVYIEPEETLELNNEILSLKFAERREIERLLKELTKKIGEQSDNLKLALQTIAYLDAIFAKAKYSIEIIGSFPSLDENSTFRILDARHPILLKKYGKEKTVPLNLNIEKDNVILITGPNAGGKTVVLKTAGLLSLMVMSGIHIPAHPDSNFKFLAQILVDIGDQQSIEDDLSTFSSHLTNIHNILNRADVNSLVLLDEIGTGTDPAEGSALASAILISLQKKNAIVLATTHHGELKLAANELEGFQNASMEFDPVKLIPTYKFKQGVPGSSYAFEVAGRIGFSNDFFELAKNYLDPDKMKIETFLIDLENKSTSLEKKLKEYELENSRLKGLTNLYQQNIERLEKQKKEIINNAKIKADEFLKDVNKKVENAIKEIRETKADKEVVKNIRKEISELKEEAKSENNLSTTDKNIILKTGDYVNVKNSQTYGKILEIEKDKAVIVSGSIKLKIKLAELLPAKKKDVETKIEFSGSYFKSDAKSNLDIRGKKPEEADFEVVKFLDDAFSAGLNRIEILHGKGTGILKKMVHEILSKHEGVKKFYFANIEHGGDGITVVELK